MRFAIENGMPYLISNGRAYPVEIKNGCVRYDKENATLANSQGVYTLEVVCAKCCKEVSSIPKRRRKTTEEE